MEKFMTALSGEIDLKMQINSRFYLGGEMNKVQFNFEIDNCCDCQNHYTEKIYTPDSFEHEEGVYCSKVNDEDSYNKKHKLVVADEWNVREWSQIPDWCPLLKSRN